MVTASRHNLSSRRIASQQKAATTTFNSTSKPFATQQSTAQHNTLQRCSATRDISPPSATLFHQNHPHPLPPLCSAPLSFSPAFRLHSANSLGLSRIPSFDLPTSCPPVTNSRSTIFCQPVQHILVDYCGRRRLRSKSYDTGPVIANCSPPPPRFLPRCRPRPSINPASLLLSDFAHCFRALSLTMGHD